MLESHLDVFKNNMGAFSEEQGERFHQNIPEMEHRYHGLCSQNLIGYIWTLIRACPLEYKLQSKFLKGVYFEKIQVLIVG